MRAKLPGRATVSVPETAAILGISRAGAYTLVQRGVIAAVKLGRRWVVPRVVLEELLKTPWRTIMESQPDDTEPMP